MRTNTVVFLLFVLAVLSLPNIGWCDQRELQTVSQIAQPFPRADGVPARSDVCFSPRWPRERNGEMPLEVAKQFHATRLEWVYLDANSKGFCKQAHETGYLVFGTVNSNLPDQPTGKATYEIGRARDLDGKRVLPAFMKGWGSYWGCANNPDFRRLWLTHAKVQIDAGADGIQMDGPRLNEGGMVSWGGCYCEHCMKGFRETLEKHRSAEQLSADGIENIQTFDYADLLRADREKDSISPEDEVVRATLKRLFHSFQRRSGLLFFRDNHKKIEEYAGRNVPFSCNNSDGFLSYLHKMHDYAMLETYPHKEGIPTFLYNERIVPLRRLGKPYVSTFISDDLALVRRHTSLCYAFGQHAIVPWDVYTGPKSPRLFGKPIDSADLYGFVRGNAKYFDAYEEAAVISPGIQETRYGKTPPIRLLGGSRQVYAVVRAVPDDPDAAVVVHLVDWSENPEPLTVVLDPRRLFGERSFHVRLLTPAPYEKQAHERAEESGVYHDLTMERKYPRGRQTNIAIPALTPWSMLVITPEDSGRPGPWQPMVWADSKSYFKPSLHIVGEQPFSKTPLHYSLDGSSPTTASPVLAEPMSIRKDTTLRVRAIGSPNDSDQKSPGEVSFQISKMKNRIALLAPNARSIKANLRLWLSADKLTSKLHDGDPVSQWTANAGPAAKVSSLKLPNGDTASAPIFRTNRLNGHAVVEFTKPSHHLDIPGFANRHLANQPFTLFMVSRSDDPQFGFSGNSQSGSGNVPRLYVMREGIIYDQNKMLRASAPPEVCAINTFQLDDNMLRTWVNGQPRGEMERPQKTRVSSFGGGHLAIPFWSSNHFHSGEFAEIAIFDHAITDGQREGIEAYFSKKYGMRGQRQWKVTQRQ